MFLCATQAHIKIKKEVVGNHQRGRGHLSESGPLPAMLVMAAGTTPEREEEFALGNPPSEAEVSAAMEVLTGGGR